MTKQETDFHGRETIGSFFKAIMKKLADTETDTVEMEMDIEGHTVSFEISITAIDIKTAAIARALPQEGAPNV